MVWGFSLTSQGVFSEAAASNFSFKAFSDIGHIYAPAIVCSPVQNGVRNLSSGRLYKR